MPRAAPLLDGRDSNHLGFWELVPSSPRPNGVTKNGEPLNENPGQACWPARGESYQRCRTCVCAVLHPTEPTRAHCGTVKAGSVGCFASPRHCTPELGLTWAVFTVVKKRGFDPRLNAKIVAGTRSVRPFAQKLTKNPVARVTPLAPASQTSRVPCACSSTAQRSGPLMTNNQAPMNNEGRGAGG